MIVDELITILGLQTDPKAKSEAGKFGKIISGVATAAVAAGAALVAASAAVQAYAARQAAAIDTSAKMADAFGLSFEAFQEIEYAAMASGAEVQEFRMDLENLAKRIADTDMMSKLGVQTRDATGNLLTLDEVLAGIAGQMEGMSTAEQNMLVDQLGLSPSALKLFQQGAGGIAALRQEALDLGLVLDSTAKEKAARYQISLLRARSVVDALGKSISVALLPAMSDSLEGFTKWIAANREFISGSIKQVVEGVGRGFEMFGAALDYVLRLVMDFIGPMGGLVEGLDATQAIALTVATALGAIAVATIAATWPIIAIGAAIVGLILIFEDLYAAIKGQPSVIGEWVKAFQEAYPGISSVLTGIFDIVTKLVSLFIDVLGPVFGRVVDIAAAQFEFLLGSIKGMLDAVEKIIMGANPFDVLGDLFKDQVDRILDLAKTLGSSITSLIDSTFGTSLSAPATTAPVPASIVQGAGGGSTMNQTVTNNINGAGNPRAVAEEVVRRSGLGQTLQMNSPGLTGPQAY